MEDHNESFYEVVERISQSSGSESSGGEGEGVPVGDPRPAAADYLESVRKDSAKGQPSDVIDESYEVRGCGCRSWFCPGCCTGRGLSVRERLIPILETFKGLLMWTFTIDPKLFTSPAEAFKYVREKRCISQTMRKLNRWGFLHTFRYFYVVEWQKESEMVHFHVLVDSSFVPFAKVCEAWNRHRPASAGPVEAERPGFGSVRFSAPAFENPRHAAHYACKYLIKFPERGFPDWVYDSDGQIHRYQASKGFWKNSEPQTPVDTPDASGVEETLSDEDCCPICAHEAVGTCDHCDECGWSVLEEPESRQRLTIRQRLAKCGERSVLLKVRSILDSQTGELKVRREFMARLEARITRIAEYMGLNRHSQRVVPIGRSDVYAIIKQFGGKTISRVKEHCGGEVTLKSLTIIEVMDADAT